MPADRAWFWALVAALTVALVSSERGWRRAASRIRARAVRRRLVEERAAQTIETDPAGPWSEPSLPGLLVGLWVCAAPWIWGYEDADGALAADLVTGSVIALVSLAGIVFPALLALNLLAGLWLTVAPWLVGYGNEGGAVGLSDTIAGIVTCGLALRGLSAATRRPRAGPPGPIGRMPRRRAP
jgi:hypothetical protein